MNKLEAGDKLICIKEIPFKIYQPTHSTVGKLWCVGDIVVIEPISYLKHNPRNMSLYIPYKDTKLTDFEGWWVRQGNEYYNSTVFDYFEDYKITEFKNKLNELISE